MCLSKVFLGYFKGTLRVFQGRIKNDSMAFQLSFKGSQEGVKDVLRMFLRSFKGVSRVSRKFWENVSKKIYVAGHSSQLSKQNGSLFLPKNSLSTIILLISICFRTKISIYWKWFVVYIWTVFSKARLLKTSSLFLSSPQVICHFNGENVKIWDSHNLANSLFQVLVSHLSFEISKYFLIQAVLNRV